MQLQKLKLFSNKKDFFIFFGIVFLIFILNISFEYFRYKKITSKKSYTTKAFVLNEYIKNNHKVIKLKSNEGFVFYTTASKRFHSVKGKYVKIRIYPYKLNFLNFLKGFYVKGWFLKTYQNNKFTKNKFESFIENQHTNKDIATIYKALFLAKPLTYELYQKFSALGVSHLFAISGFHLGIISAVLFFIAKMLYSPLHSKFFPYRHKNRDIFIFVAIVSFLYLDFLEFPPSLVRAYVMFIVGFFLYDRYFEVFSEYTLLVAIFLIVAFFPRFLFSLGFWLSVLGTYYIILYIKYTSHIKPLYQFFLLPTFVYIAMLPTSVYIFHNFSIYHPLSILATIGFGVFYPLAFLAHLLNVGDIFDDFLNIILTYNINLYKIDLPKVAWLLYLGISFFALFFEKMFYIFTVTGVVFLLFLFY